MIEKPNISDEKIMVALHENYFIQASEIEFLPIGNDASAFAYRVETKNQISYFLKIKIGERVFLTKNTGESTKQEAVEGFVKLFSQGDVIEAAFNASVEI
jgi:hypothetical protein